MVANNTPRMHSRLVGMTPTMAARLLEKDKADHRNRPLREAKVMEYARMMLDGQWQASHQGIAIADDGVTIIDGQHRLWAVVMAGVEVPIQITYGLPIAVQAVVDDGVRRTAKDVLNIEGAGVSTSQVAVLSRMLMGGRVGSGTGALAYQRPTKQQMVQLWEKYGDGVEFAVKDAFGGRAMRGVTSAGVLAPVARAYYAEVNALPRLRTFGKVMLDGVPDHTEQDQAALLLRNWLLTSGRGRGGGAYGALVYRKAARALRSFLEKQRLGKLYESSDELFPLPAEERFIKRVAKVQNQVLQRQQQLFRDSEAVANGEDKQ